MNTNSTKNIIKGTFLPVLTLLLATIISGCFQKKHRISELHIEGSSPSINNQISLCLDESIGVSSYLLKFNVTLIDGTQFNVEDDLWAGNESEKKCFDLFLGASFTNRATTENEEENIKNIYSGNVKSIKVQIFDREGREKISEQTFNNL